MTLEEKKNDPLPSIDKVIKQTMMMEDDPYQTANATSTEAGKEYMRRLTKILDENKGVEGTYYIQVFLRRDTPSPKILHFTFVTRRTLPEPEWDQSVYEVENFSNSVFLRWSLPTRADALQILIRPDLFAEKLVQDCSRMLQSDDKDGYHWAKEKVNV